MAAAARRVLSWLSMLVLAGNILAGAVLPARPAMAVPPGGGIVICTAAGMKVIDPSGKTSPVSAAEHGMLCAFCLPLLHGGTAVPMAAMVVSPQAVETIADFAAVAVSSPVAPAIRLASPRAPPLLA